MHHSAVRVFMLRGHRRAPVGIALLLVLAQGCYAYAPTAKLRPGMKVRVDTRVPVEVRDSSATQPAVPCRAARFEGTLASIRADTLALHDVSVSHAEDQGACGSVSRLTLATSRDATEVTARQLDRWTTGKTLGAGALLVGLAVVLSHGR